MIRSLKTGLLTAAVLASAAGGAWAFDPVNTTAFVNGVDETKIRSELVQLQAIADRSRGNRAAGTIGYRDSVIYVRDALTAAGYAPRTQPFSVDLFSEQSPPALARISPSPETYVAGTDVLSLEYSAKGDVSARIVLVGRTRIPPASTPGSTQSGCDPSDFPAVTTGRIALIQRGTCDFAVKVRNAQAAGAVAAIVFNEGQPGRTAVLNGTLGSAVGIPAVGVTYAVGEELYTLARAGAVNVRVAVDSTITRIDTFNVLADLPGRNPNRTVVVGAHLDSVAEGPGINDNGSGIAAILTIAKEFKRQGIQPQNTVRFAFWGAEESGLLGSTFYVNDLAETEIAKIAANLNFDMLGSRNFARFVYDGDGTIGDAGPQGSDIIESVFTAYFDARGLPSEPTLFDGRSDYLPFINAGIPAGGLFSGAEGVKTAAQVELYGGVAGRAYDSCYHAACDTISNLSNGSLRIMGKAAAHATFTFAQTLEDVRTASGAKVAQAQKRNAAAANATYRGSKLIR